MKRLFLLFLSLLVSCVSFAQLTTTYAVVEGANAVCGSTITCNSCPTSSYTYTGNTVDMRATVNNSGYVTFVISKCDGTTAYFTYGGIYGIRENTCDCPGSIRGNYNANALSIRDYLQLPTPTVVGVIDYSYYGMVESYTGSNYLHYRSGRVTIRATTTYACNLSNPQASTTNATCGESNGRIVISASGGTGNYEYAVDGNWSSNNIFSNLAAGQYQVSVRERNYPSCERSTNVTISNTGSAPQITTQPEDATICTGRSAVLRVTATGTGLSYQWKKDGQNVGSSSSYTATAAGDYMCVVSSNSCGQVESDVAIVTVNTRPDQPTITPSTGTTEVDQSVLFGANAAPDATYAWTFQNGTPSTSTDANPSVQFTSPGTKTVSLTVSNNCGPSPVANLNVTVVAACPNIDITTQPVGGDICQGRNKVLSVVATGGTLRYQWKKDGTNITNAIQASYTAMQAGDYTCEITNTCGATPVVSEVATIVVNNVPNRPVITPPTGTLQAGQSIILTSNADPNLTHTWTFQDGTPSSSTDATPSVMFTSPGSKIVSLTVSDNNNCGASPVANLNVTVVAACPDIDITTQPIGDDICPGNHIDLSIVATNGTIYQWKKDGIDIPNATQRTYRATEEGSYTCLVKSSCDQVGIESDPAEVTVINVSANFTANSNGLTVSFTNTSQNGLTWLWRFGNNTSSTQESPTVTYATAGSYTVNLTATNGTCTSNTVRNIIVINNATNCTLTATAQVINQTSCGLSNGSAQVTAQGGAAPYTYAWSNGVTTPSVSNLPAGNYTVTVSDANSCTATSSVTINASTAPAASFSKVIDGLTVRLTNSSNGTATATNWTFGNNTSSTEANPTVTYAAAGTYTITLRITTTCGVIESSQSVTVTTNNNTNNSNTTVIYENAKVLGISNVVAYNNKATLIVGTETTPQPNGYPDNGTWAKKGNIINEDGAMPNGLIQNAPFQTFDTDIKVNPSNQALGIVYQFPTGTSYGFRLPYKEYLNGAIIRDESAFTNANWGYLPRLIYHADGSSEITSFGHAGYILKSFGRSSTGTWTSQDITGFSTHFSPQASVLHNNKLYLATRNNTSSPYPLVLFTKSNGVWANEQVASMIDNVCDMVMNGDEINVLFTEGRNLKIAKRNVNTTTWQYENVLVQDSIYHRASLLFDGTDSYICLQKGHVTNAQAIVLKKANGGAWNPIFTKSDFIFDADFWSWGRRPSILKVGNRLLAVYSDNRKVYKTELNAAPACNLQTQITPNRSNATICEGDSVVLRATRTNPNQTFIWSDGATTDSIIVNSAGTYSVTITEGNCTATASQVVTVNALPNITISGDTSFCHGSSATITAQGANSFVWSTGGTTPSVRINSAGIFSVQGTAANGCIATKEFEIEEKALPSIQIVSSRENGQATLEANADDCNFAWSNGAQTPTITVPVGAVYYVTATDTITGCTNRDSISTAILYTLKPNEVYCGNNSDTLWFDLRMDKRRPSIDAFSFTGQFDTTMLRPILNRILRGTALPTSANINTVLSNDSISIFIDVAQGSIEGDSNTLVIRIPFVWRVPRTANMQTALSWSVLEERIWSSTSDHDQTTVIVKGTNVAEILLKKPTGAAFIRPTGKESTVRPTTECTATPSVARGFNPNTGTYRIRTDSFSHGAELRSKPAAQVPTGIIDANDVYLLRQIQQGNMPLTQRNTLLGDVNGDGAVTLLDVTLLRRRAIGIITNFAPYGRLSDDWLYFDENNTRIANCFEIQRNADQCDTVKVPITVLHVGDLDSSSNNLRVLEAMRIEPHLVKTQPRLFLDSCNARRTGVSNEWKIPVRASDFVKSLDLHFLGLTIPVTTMRVEAAKARVESNAIGQNYYIVAYSDSLAGISPRDTLFFLYYRTNNINLAELGDIYTVLNTELVRTGLASCNTQTNVQNYSIENNVNIFPNPTIGNLTIDIQNLSIPNTEILIFNSLGQILLRKNVEDMRTNLALQDFANGVYFVKVTTKDANGMGSVVKKITVAK